MFKGYLPPRHELKAPYHNNYLILKNDLFFAPYHYYNPIMPMSLQMFVVYIPFS